MAKPGLLPEITGAEIAFAGRSNAGKSTTLNALCRQNSLARTSKTPGRTQMINYFRLSNGNSLVDLPGYGYAKAPIKERDAWGRLVEFYFNESPALRAVVIVMDIRHPLQDMDWQMIEWCQAGNLPLLLLLNKADKFKRGAAASARLQVIKALKEVDLEIEVMNFSALRKTGLEELQDTLSDWLTPDTESEPELDQAD